MNFHFVKEFIWLGPFALTALITLAPLRPQSVLPPPSNGRIVTDVDGVKVAVPLPFRTIRGCDFLQVTHAPEAVYKVGDSRDRAKFTDTLMSRFYPDVLRNDGLWDTPTDRESLLAHSDGVTFFFGKRPDLWVRLGIPMLATAIQTDHVFAVTRLANAALGRETYGEALIADYRQAFADLGQELKPETFTTLPRSLAMASSANDWSDLPASYDVTHTDQISGAANAIIGFEATGRQQEAERILAMNPDFVFVTGESVDDFLQDRRWQGLKAVVSKHVYRGGNEFSPCSPTWHLDEDALQARLKAEILHPDRLQPRVRELARAHFLKAYGYRLSEDEIDTILGVEMQKNSFGYRRFLRDNQVTGASARGP